MRVAPQCSACALAGGGGHGACAPVAVTMQQLSFQGMQSAGPIRNEPHCAPIPSSSLCLIIAQKDTSVVRNCQRPASSTLSPSGTLDSEEVKPISESSGPKLTAANTNRECQVTYRQGEERAGPPNEGQGWQNAGRGQQMVGAWELRRRLQHAELIATQKAPEANCVLDQHSNLRNMLSLLINDTTRKEP